MKLASSRSKKSRSERRPRITASMGSMPRDNSEVVEKLAESGDSVKNDSGVCDTNAELMSFKTTSLTTLLLLLLSSSLLILVVVTLKERVLGWWQDGQALDEEEEEDLTCLLFRRLKNFIFN